MRNRLNKPLVGATVLGALALGGVAIAGAFAGGERDDTDRPLTGPIAERAADAALREAGGGKVGGVEVDTEAGASYAVEVTKTDGSKIDVRLDDRFVVIGVESADHESRSASAAGADPDD